MSCSIAAVRLAVKRKWRNKSTVFQIANICLSGRGVQAPHSDQGSTGHDTPVLLFERH